MPSFIYKGPATGLTFTGGKEIMLFDGTQVELPDCEEVQTLKALGRLTPVRVVSGQPATMPTASASDDKKGA